MRIIITEQQYKKLNKSSESISNAIIKYMNQYISKGKRKINRKPRSYGNLGEDWCIDGKETIRAYYTFDNDKFDKGQLSVSRNLVNLLSDLLSIRNSYVLNTIAEWYDETMVPKFEEIVGESGLSIDDIWSPERDKECVPEPEKPEGITDEEMIDYIVKNTLYNKEEVIGRIESGEDLEEFYLHIVDIKNRKRITGF
jgi:hypothetical protein